MGRREAATTNEWRSVSLQGCAPSQTKSRKTHDYHEVVRARPPIRHAAPYQQDGCGTYTYFCPSWRSGWTSGARPGKPPVGPFGLEAVEPFFGFPGTVGIFCGLAVRIRSSVQYPESASECCTVRPVTSAAKAGLTIAEPASISIGTSAGITKADPTLWILPGMRQPPT